jgi:hypothetical protein
MWANIGRGSWLKTLGAACLGYLAMVWLSITSQGLLTDFLARSRFLSTTFGYFLYLGDIRPGDYHEAQAQVFGLLVLAAAFPPPVLGGDLAACMRPGAPVVIAVISAISGAVSLMANGDRAPWIQVALTVLLPIAALAGGRMRIRKRVGSE